MTRYLCSLLLLLAGCAINHPQTVQRDEECEARKIDMNIYNRAHSDLQQNKIKCPGDAVVEFK